jgi:hypothetical protein
MEKPKDTKPQCPIIQGECVEAGCKFWTKLATQYEGKTEETWECTILFIPFLMLEQSKMIARNAVSIETLRNEQVNTGNKLIQAILQVSNQYKQLPPH